MSLYFGCHQVWPKLTEGLPTSNDLLKKIPHKCAPLLGFECVFIFLWDEAKVTLIYTNILHFCYIPDLNLIGFGFFSPVLIGSQRIEFPGKESYTSCLYQVIITKNLSFVGRKYKILQ